VQMDCRAHHQLDTKLPAPVYTLGEIQYALPRISSPQLCPTDPKARFGIGSNTEAESSPRRGGSSRTYCVDGRSYFQMSFDNERRVSEAATGFRKGSAVCRFWSLKMK
jgi:hypothetical protein